MLRPPCLQEIQDLTRLLEPIGDVPPAEFEAAYYRKEDPNYTDRLSDPSLR